MDTWTQGHTDTGTPRTHGHTDPQTHDHMDTRTHAGTWTPCQLRQRQGMDPAQGHPPPAWQGGWKEE